MRPPAKAHLGPLEAGSLGLPEGAWPCDTCFEPLDPSACLALSRVMDAQGVWLGEHEAWKLSHPVSACRSQTGHQACPRSQVWAGPADA